jgi:medium-chain acyl-[acyl-carrier-protein] hydrolase
MKYQSTANRWLILPKPNPAAAMRLVCFPYAGGSPLVFCKWPQELPDNIEVCPVQLPGRGMRLPEPPFTKVENLLESLVPALRPFLDKPFAFFGHSMGGLISFELARALQSSFGQKPAALFIAGRQAPPLQDRTACRYDLPEPEFLKQLRDLNGTPPEILEQPELLRLLIPLLRADFELCQTYVCKPGPPLDCPIFMFGGVEDNDVSQEELESWRPYTTGAFSLRMLPGDHFFIQSAQAQLLKMVSEDLRQLPANLSLGGIGHVRPNYPNSTHN